MKMPVVSVVIIFLDAERFLREAIASVFAQSCTDWELLLVDDGSTDGSTSIARDYAHTAPERVRYLEHAGHANRGMSASRNLGISAAAGSLIAFLDSDDVWVPRKLEEQLAILKANSRAQMVCGRSVYWESWAASATSHADKISDLCGPADAVAEPPALLRRWFDGQRTIPSQSNIIFRRDMATRVGGFEETFRGLYEDLALTAKIYLHEPVYVADRCWDYIRRHPESCVARTSPREWETARHRFLTWLEQYLIAQGLRDSEFWLPLQKELWPYRHPVRSGLSRLQRRAQTWLGTTPPADS